MLQAPPNRNATFPATASAWPCLHNSNSQEDETQGQILVIELCIHPKTAIVSDSETIDPMAALDIERSNTDEPLNESNNNNKREKLKFVHKSKLTRFYLIYYGLEQLVTSWTDPKG